MVAVLSYSQEATPETVGRGANWAQGRPSRGRAGGWKAKVWGQQLSAVFRPLGEGVRGLRVLIWAHWVLRLIILIISYVTLGKLFNLPTPQLFSSLKWANGIYLSGAQSMLICSAYIFFMPGAVLRHRPFLLGARRLACQEQLQSRGHAVRKPRHLCCFPSSSSEGVL